MEKERTIIECQVVGIQSPHPLPLHSTASQALMGGVYVSACPSCPRVPGLPLGPGGPTTKAGVNGSFMIRTHALTSSHSPTKIRALTWGVPQGDLSWRAPLPMEGGEVVPQVPHFIEHLLNTWLCLISNTQKFYHHTCMEK